MLLDGSLALTKKTALNPENAKFSTFDAAMKPLDSYESAFQAGGLLGIAAPTGLTALKSSIAELAKDYRLQGVVVLDQPEAILQDARTQKTVFVKKGDRLGELTIKEIKEAAVILACYGEETVLQIQ
jgi:hypothetical protein